MEQGLCSSADLRKYLRACENGDLEWVDNALESGIVQVDASDDQGFTGLQMAAANGHEELVRLLIMRGAALEKCNFYDWTPLLHAARHGHTTVVALLLQNGAEISRKTCMGGNALTYAVKGGHTKTACFLLDRQIEFDMIATPCELSAMSVASLLGHDAALRLLSDRGWDINQRMQSTFMTPLMCAAINGHMTTAQNLMERGCDPNLTDVNDKTALQLAQDRGKREVVGFLDRKTSNKLSIDGTMNAQMCGFNGIFLDLAYRGVVDEELCYIDYGSMMDEYVQEEDFLMDIVEATKIGDIGRVREILLTDNAQKDFCLPLDGATPLMYASMSGRIDIAMLLVENGCDINKQDKISSWTALMQAIFHGKKQVAKFLIASGADVTLSAKNGITAFDMASFIDDVDTDLLRLLAAKTMFHKSSKKGDSLKRLSGGKNGTNGAEFVLDGGGKKWWNKFSSHLKNFTKTFQIKGSKTNDSAKAKMKMTRMNSTSTMNLPLGDLSDFSTYGALTFMDKKKSASLYHLNSVTPHSTVTMPLGLGGGGASGGETLKPVIPPFLPQPSYELTAETWGLPTQQKSQSTLDLTVNSKHPMIRPMNVRSGRDGPGSPSSENRFSFGSPSPNSSGGASSISAMHSAPTSGSSATSSTLTPNNVDRFNRRPYDLDFRYNKTPSFLFNNASHNKYSSQPRLSPTGFSPSSSINSAYKRNRFSDKSRSRTSPNLTANGRYNKTSATLYDSGTSTGNSEMLSSSASSQGVILELEGEHTEESEANDLGCVLKNLSLEKYQSIFEKEEVDMEAFLMLDENDLCELGITHTDSQRQILSAISDLSSNNHVQRHRNELNDNIEATIPVRNSAHSDSTDMDEWYLHSQPNLTPTQAKETT